jgi:hypothetical protein
MNIQKYINAVDETARTQMGLLVDAVQAKQQQQFLDLIDLFTQRGNLVENAQRLLPSLEGVDMGFIHNLRRKMTEYNNWHARELGAAPKAEDVVVKPKGKLPPIKDTP